LRCSSTLSSPALSLGKETSQGRGGLGDLSVVGAEHLPGGLELAAVDALGLVELPGPDQGRAQERQRPAGGLMSIAVVSFAHLEGPSGHRDRLRPATLRLQGGAQVVEVAEERGVVGAEISFVHLEDAPVEPLRLRVSAGVTEGVGPRRHQRHRVGAVGPVDAHHDGLPSVRERQDLVELALDAEEHA
jgi:hypothetical protein